MIEKLIGIIVTYVLRFFWKEGSQWLADYTDRKKIEAINEENLRRYNESINQKLPAEERKRRARDLINGVDNRIK